MASGFFPPPFTGEVSPKATEGATRARTFCACTPPSVSFADSFPVNGGAKAVRDS
jgi:hypothetical protein